MLVTSPASKMLDWGLLMGGHLLGRGVLFFTCHPQAQWAALALPGSDRNDPEGFLQPSFLLRQTPTRTLDRLENLTEILSAVL